MTRTQAVTIRRQQLQGLLVDEAQLQAAIAAIRSGTFDQETPEAKPPPKEVKPKRPRRPNNWRYLLPTICPEEKARINNALIEKFEKALKGLES
jgi:hypothetical protein